MENLSESESELNSTEIVEDANIATLDLLPSKSKARYENVYQVFEEWSAKHKVTEITEDVILAYLTEKSTSLKSSSLWSLYSMLKATLNINKNVDLKKYSKVIAFLKKKSVGYRAKKSEMFTRDQCDRFLQEADDVNYLMIKVVLIVGLAGACRCEELYKMTVDCIEDNSTNIVINIPDSKTHARRTFTVAGSNNMAIYRKYTALRPPHIQHRKLFLYYTSGSASNTGRDDSRTSLKTANLSRQGVDKEENLTLLSDSKPDEERCSLLPEEISESGADVLSSGSDPSDVESAQHPKTAYFSPFSSAEVYNTGLPSCLCSSNNWLRKNETELETSSLDNPPLLSGVINDACSKFFQSMADTVRDLPPDLQILAKRNVLHAVTECELTALNRLNVSKN